MNRVTYKSSDLTLTFTDAIIQTVSGTLTSWLPVTTPWTAFASCSTEVYAQLDHNAILFDPYYQTSVVPGANSAPCLPPEATAWWDQEIDNVILLGPTFVCPLAYSAVETLVANSATQQTLCCPSSFGLHIPMITKGAFPSQCTSMISSGASYIYMTSTSGAWGLYTEEITDPYTVYAIPVNGFNIHSTTTISTLATPATNPATTPATNPATSLVTSTGTAITPVITLASASATVSNAQPASLSLKDAVGVGIGVCVGVLLLVGAFILIYRRWKRRQQSTHGEINQSEQEPPHQHENQLQPSRETHSRNIYHDVDGANQNSMKRSMAVFELGDQR
ncbi:hypothetical protein NHQ30_011235 [Ciborinia camelliae]|nr:hypothetical protein NHQ30_011235 [Ciborinia camelliae]